MWTFLFSFESNSSINPLARPKIKFSSYLRKIFREKPSHNPKSFSFVFPFFHVHRTHRPRQSAFLPIGRTWNSIHLYRINFRMTFMALMLLPRQQKKEGKTFFEAFFGRKINMFEQCWYMESNGWKTEEYRMTSNGFSLFDIKDVPARLPNCYSFCPMLMRLYIHIVFHKHRAIEIESLRLSPYRMEHHSLSSMHVITRLRFISVPLFFSFHCLNYNKLWSELLMWLVRNSKRIKVFDGEYESFNGFFEF